MLRTYPVVVVQFREAIGIWVEEVMLEHFNNASCYSIHRHCHYRETVGILSLPHCTEDGLPVKKLFITGQKLKCPILFVVHNL